MDDHPDIDGRRRRELREHATAIAPYYTDAWTPEADDAGLAMVGLFAEIAEQVVERLDRLPEKHQIAFLDTLGFSRRPAQPARAPITFEIAPGADANVRIKGGTEAVASDDDLTFRIPTTAGFEATPAQLQHVISVDPETDRIFLHHDHLSATTNTRLFGETQPGDNQQEHILYIGHPEQLTGGEWAPPETDEEADEAGTGNTGRARVIEVEIETNTPVSFLRDLLVWEYYGERTIEGEPKEGWHPFRNKPGWFPVLHPSITPDLDPLTGTTLRAALRDHGFDTDTVERMIEATLRPDPTDPTSRTRSFATAGSLPTGRDDRFTRTNPFPDPRGSLRERIPVILLEELPVRLPFEPRPDRRVLELEYDGTITETEVAGIESRWIRCRIPPWYRGTELFDITVGTGSRPPDPGTGPVRLGPPADTEMTPDTLLANDTELPTHNEIYPFGRVPRPQTAFHIAAEEPFSKPNAAITIEFLDSSWPVPANDQTDGNGPIVDADIAWEYWNGNGWARLPVTPTTTATNDHELLTTVGFTVPPDLTPTEVAGHPGHWIRARIVSGGYGAHTARRSDNETEIWTAGHDITPPRINGIRIAYDTDDPGGMRRPAAHLVTKNNLAYSPDLARTRPASFTPFVRVPDTHQTLYLGFHGPLTGGPINLLVDTEETQYPDEFHPRVRWETRDPASETWRRLPGRDTTESLTQRGISSLTFPQPTRSASLFGRQAHWIRARVTRDQFGTNDQPTLKTAHSTAADNPDLPSGLQPCVERIQTTPPAGEPRNTLPVLAGLYPNTAWAENVRVITDETLGSSDGTRNQTFTVATPPVTDAEVWVDELRVLSTLERTTLQQTQPDRVTATTDRTGEPTAFWVKWTPVPDFLDSDEDDRHFHLDRVTGRITFGDGTHGRIPPRGTDNIRGTYRTGGGAHGNIDAGTVDTLRTAIALVDDVTNPLPADGGANEEAMTQVTTRAPKTLRDRDRAVTPPDFERIALDASRLVARAKCLSGMDPTGMHAPGWVTLLIVPNTRDPKPVPSLTLREDVGATVRDRAPAALVGDPDHFVVRGPSYVTVSVTATLKTTGTTSISALEETATDGVTAYLHPLTGGPESDGWKFGEVPCLSDFYAYFERIENVDHVAELAVEYQGSESAVTVREGDPDPTVSPDTLVHTGTHEITVELARHHQAPRIGGPG